MIEFLIKVLASNLFWAGYIIVSGIASIILMRKGPYHWLALLTKDSKSAYAVVEKYGQENHLNDDEMVTTVFAAAMGALGFMIIWPFIAVVFVIIQLCIVIGKFLALLLKGFFTALDKITPDVSINIKKEE